MSIIVQLYKIAVERLFVLKHKEAKKWYNIMLNTITDLI